MREMRPDELAELFVALRDELDDLEKVAERRRQEDGHHPARPICLGRLPIRDIGVPSLALAESLPASGRVCRASAPPQSSRRRSRNNRRRR
jgi:hypothetical protein